MGILEQDDITVMREEDLIDKYLRGRQDELGMPQFDEYAERFVESSAVVFGDDVGDDMQMLAAQILPCQFPNEDTGEAEDGYIAHVVVYDFDTFSMIDRPVLAIAAHRSVVSDAIGSNGETELMRAMYDTLRDMAYAEATR